MSKNTELRLLVSSGNGPAECRRLVSHAVNLMRLEALQANVVVEVTTTEITEKTDPASVIVSFFGINGEALAKRWTGTIQWTCKSPFRPNHKRRNWFVGVYALPSPSASYVEFDSADLRFESFRAGGPGGQHQNTTNSAVRVTHTPSGIVTMSRDERSQHRNKQTALHRLADKMVLRRSQAIANANSDMATLHKQLERGNPVRRFKGSSFREVLK